MIDQWFKKDLEKILNQHDKVVFVDESTEASFLMKTGFQDAITYSVSNEIEELKAKYEIEKSNKNVKTIIYTTTPKDQLKFIREYCETNGCVEIKYLDHYIKKKVSEHLNLNINLPKEELISAAKVSIGKSQTYWMDLSHKGSSEIFDLEKELLPFIGDPEGFVKKYDLETQIIFYKKVNELIGQPYMQKPSVTLANEVVSSMFDGLLNNNITEVLLSVYLLWIDSHSYQDSLIQHLKKYKVKPKAQIFEIHPSHPFESVDIEWLKEIGAGLTNKEKIISILPKVNQRASNKAASRMGIRFWKEIKVLLDFDEKNISQISSFSEAVQFYKTQFCNIDSAIRKLYSKFLTDKNIIEPWQELYQHYVALFLDKWFRYIASYESTQTGKIQDIIDQNSSKTAIVVGDGISWEFAQDIVKAMGKTDFKLEQNHMLAGLPSETEHNMSQLYIDTGDVLSTKKERENYLAQTNADKQIEFIDLENVNESTDSAQYLVCSYKDPDKLGETYQQKALKYFDEVASTYARKIRQLFDNGYQQVFLVTDHGFTLTGLLENAEKIEVDFTGNVEKNERFIRTNEAQVYDKDLLIEKSVSYKEFSYCYFSKRLGPFKTPGVYGFSHGGLSPQETVIPCFKWSNSALSEQLLGVSIGNKSDLSEVTGNLFTVKLSASSKTQSLFSSERKVFLIFFVDGVEVNKSDVITIQNGDHIKKEYEFDRHQKIELKLLDANTREQLDKAVVNKSSARDLGGLL